MTLSSTRERHASGFIPPQITYIWCSYSSNEYNYKCLFWDITQVYYLLFLLNKKSESLSFFVYMYVILSITAVDAYKNTIWSVDNLLLIREETYWVSNEPVHEISNNLVCATSKGSDQPAHTRSLIRAFASRLGILWLLSYWLKHHLEFLSLMEEAQTRLSLHLSKCQIVGNLMPRLK